MDTVLQDHQKMAGQVLEGPLPSNIPALLAIGNLQNTKISNASEAVKKLEIPKIRVRKSLITNERILSFGAFPRRRPRSL